MFVEASIRGGAEGTAVVVAVAWDGEFLFLVVTTVVIESMLLSSIKFSCSSSET